MSAARWALIQAIWRVRQCFVCGQTGDCVHREIEFECALIDASTARDNPRNDAHQGSEAQSWLPGFGPVAKRVEVERVH